MPRPYVFGNGQFLIQSDQHLQVRDFCYPLPGLWNHTAGLPIRFGVWCNGHFAWSDHEDWVKTSRYLAGSMIAETVLKHAGMGLDITVHETMDETEPWFIRKFVAENHSGHTSDVRLFFCHDMNIEESDIGDTAIWIPDLDGLVHFKRQHYFLFGGDPVYQCTTSIKGYGYDGSWRDAEDGELSPAPVNQGNVDSVLSLRAEIHAGDAHEFRAWILCGTSFDDLRDQRDRFIAQVPHFAYPEPREQSRLDALYEHSLNVIETQCGVNGAILAANDSDIMMTNRANYSYVWPRDGALVGMAMDLAGRRHVAEHFFEFCLDLVSPSQPFYLHKYSPDGSLGATWHPWLINGKPEVPFQQDETSLTALAWVRHYRDDANAPAEQFEKLVKWACDFMAKHIDPSTGLPLPSYDLWEERRGVHAYTVATTIAALTEASEMASEPGWKEAADRMREGMLKHMTDPETGRVWRCLKPTEGGYEPDRTVDSATLAIPLYGILPLDHPVAESTIDAVETKLWMKDGITGVGRYEGDYYFRQTDDFPGNPWIICTMWLAQLEIMRGRPERTRGWLNWVCDRATSTGILSEQFHPLHGAPLSVSPLTWSHAEFVRTVAMLR